MADTPETFDPYYKWLGIPPAEQPPTLYRLLGLRPFESDPDVISNAADRAMAHVRTFQTGARATFSQNLLNELSQARVCLLSEKQKESYDALMRQKMEEVTNTIQPIAPPTATKRNRGLTVARRKKKQKDRHLIAIVVLLLILATICAIAYLVFRKPPVDEGQSLAQPRTSNSSAA